VKWLRSLLGRIKRRFLSKRSTGDEVNPYNYPLF
jgi:hypothetical protein